MRRILATPLAVAAALMALLVLGCALALASQPPAKARAAAAHRATAAHRAAGRKAKAHKRRRHHRHGRRHHHHGHGRRHHRRHRRHHARKHHRAGASKRSATRASYTCPNTGLTPTSEDLVEIRAATLCLINRERALHGDRPLQVDGKLNRAAQGHSEDMVAKDYFSHYGPSGDTPASRMRAAGYIYSSNIGYEVGENIAWGTLGLASPSAIVEAWMHSPGHRANILDPRFRETGIGIVAAVPRSDADREAGAIYTQDFGLIITG